MDFYQKTQLSPISGKKYTFNGYSNIAFYESGKVKYGRLAQDTTVTIDGIPYTLAADKNSYIEFYESGKVGGWKLSKGAQLSPLTASPIPLSILFPSMRVAR